MICEIRADKCYIPRTYISGFDLHKRLDVGTGLAQSVKQTRVPMVLPIPPGKKTFAYNYFHKMISDLTLKAIDQLAWQYCIVQK